MDFEQGLNNAMKRLRAALDDDSENPRFIETLPQHGYRFIGAVNGAERIPVAETRATRSSPPLVRLGAIGTLVVIVLISALRALNVRGWRDRLLVRAPKAQIQVVAVLPLGNLSGDPEQEYFADGMTEALITELGKISSTRVISRQSIMQYKGSKKSLQEVAQELKVDAVVIAADIRNPRGVIIWRNGAFAVISPNAANSANPRRKTVPGYKASLHPSGRVTL